MEKLKVKVAKWGTPKKKIIFFNPQMHKEEGNGQGVGVWQNMYKSKPEVG
jgi:hypothetical protein